MAKNDVALIRLSDIGQAIALLTRLPVKSAVPERGGAAAWAYPLVGLVTGGCAALTGGLAVWFGLPSALAALMSLSTLVIVTGAMHEDGLADTADGLWGGWTQDRRLEIMKDSHIGTYGVIALFLSLSARWAALWLLFQLGTGTAAAALLTSGILSRASMPALMASLPHARQSGLSHSVGTATSTVAWISFGIAMALVLLVSGWAGLWAAFWVLIVTYGMALIANRKVGGQTGDILGATQQIAEIAVLLSLLA